MSVNTIMVDLGGVLLHLNYGLTKQAFEHLGVQPFDQYFNQHQANELFSRLEKGLLSSSEFLIELRSVTGIEASDQEICNAWNAMLLNFENDNLEWLEQKKKDFIIILLSNTNQIHYDAFMSIYKNQFLRNDFNNRYFHTTYYSHEVQLRKPDFSIFQYVIENEKIDPSSTLFIDDTIGNISAAQEIGFLTCHVNSISNWTKEVSNML